MATESTTLRVGVLSDTHGFLDPTIAGIFAGVHHILHGGDVGSLRILNELEAIAPVTAVTGNTDYNLEGCRDFESVRLAGQMVFVEHIVEPEAPAGVLRARLKREPPGLIVFGHTHKPYWRRIDSVWYLNPGYAGKRRFSLARSVAIAEISSAGIDAEIIPLDR